jgi:subtilisin family serine protease
MSKTFALISALAIIGTALAVPSFEAASNIVEGEFIVTLKPTASVEQHMANVAAMLSANGFTASQAAIKSTFAIGSQEKSGNSFLGYHAEFSDAEVAQVMNMDDVVAVEKNQIYTTQETEGWLFTPDTPAPAPAPAPVAGCTTQSDATWGIVRTDERDLKIDGFYNYETNAGKGVDVYVIDTGVYTENTDFQGRAVFGHSTTGESTQGDGNGHGTHCAGTIMSETWGLAKDATAIAVKVLSNSGSGTTAGVIAGIEWAAADAQKKKKTAIGNMSLGGGFSAAMNAATNAAFDAGLLLVVAAGNDNRDACSYSPASATKAFTVGATDIKDARSTFSNTGDCVDIFAPGTNIKSTWIGTKTATNTISGTSMAAPHVAGVAAKYLAANPKASPQEIKDALIAAATPNKLTGLTAKCPNKLLFQACQA